MEHKFKPKSLVDLQDDDLSLARSYADDHKNEFNDEYLHKLELEFDAKGTLTTHQWSVLQKIIEKYDMQGWEERGNR